MIGYQVTDDLMNDPPAGSNVVDVDGVKPYFIPEELIEDWNAIDRDAILELKLPRAAFDLLFDAVHDSLAATAAVQRSLIASMFNDPERLRAQTLEAARASQLAQNNLRKWHTVVMGRATGQEIKFTDDGKGEE